MTDDNGDNIDDGVSSRGLISGDLGGSAALAAPVGRVGGTGGTIPVGRIRQPDRIEQINPYAGRAAGRPYVPAGS